MTIGRVHEGPPPQRRVAFAVIRPKTRACGHPPPGRRSRRLPEIKPQIAGLAPPGEGVRPVREACARCDETFWNFYLGKPAGQPRRDQGGAGGGAGSVPPARWFGGGRFARAPLFAAVPLAAVPLEEVPLAAAPL